jgi:hypothetical protein
MAQETVRLAGATADTGLREACRLEPAENMALTVAWHQVERGEEPMPNVASVCVMALERIRRAALDATAAPTTDTGARDE